MTDELANSLGLRALALGMPWAEGLLDGRWILRVGCYDHPDYEDNNPHQPSEASWPDFRDPLTEAWLVAWATMWAWQYAPDIYEEYPGRPDSDPWRIVFGDGALIVYGETRAEAWINALEQLRGAK